MRIPGLSFSWKHAVGLTQVKQQLARKTGVPTSKAGLDRKIGSIILKSIFGKRLIVRLEPFFLRSESALR